MTEIRRHARLLAILVAVEFATVALPYVLWLRRPGTLDAGWLAHVADNFGGMLVLWWTWLLAVPLIAVGAYWSEELSDGFFLEAWRHYSFATWMWGRLVFGACIGLIGAGLGLWPVLLVAYPGEAPTATAIVALLAVYSAILALPVLIAPLYGAPMQHVLAGVLFFHAIGLALDGTGMPNLIALFLLGEQGSVFSAGVGVVVAIVAMTVAARFADPTILSMKGSTSR